MFVIGKTYLAPIIMITGFIIIISSAGGYEAETLSFIGWALFSLAGLGMMVGGYKLARKFGWSF